MEIKTIEYKKTELYPADTVYITLNGENEDGIGFCHIVEKETRRNTTYYEVTRIASDMNWTEEEVKQIKNNIMRLWPKEELDRGTGTRSVAVPWTQCPVDVEEPAEARGLDWTQLQVGDLVPADIFEDEVWDGAPAGLSHDYLIMGVGLVPAEEVLPPDQILRPHTLWAARVIAMPADAARWQGR